MTRTLLLADDSVTIQRVIQLTFAEEDVKVVAVGDGDQAIARVETQPPDIVLADVGMPGKNGYEVAKYIKRSPQLAHIPVLLLTGVLDPIDQRKAAEAGCDGVLAKPFEPQLVIGRVRELLERPGAGPPPDPAAAPPPQNVEAEPPRADVRGPEVAGDAESNRLDEFFERLDAAMGRLPQDAVEPAMAASAQVPAVDAPGPAGATPPGPSEGSALPALREAFAALLAAEQTSGSTPAAQWPTGPVIGNELVERVAARVLERMSDSVVRAAVTGIVSSIAERLVREEIERIKAAMK